MRKILSWIRSLFRKSVKINLEYPISWETMDFNDFRNVCIILSTPHGKQETLFLCLCKLAHIRPDDYRKYNPKAIKNKMPFIIDGKSYIIRAEVIAAACEQLSFIFDDIGLPPAPFIDVDRKLYGISFNQLFKADSLILAGIAQNNGKMLADAAKCLTNGKVRRLLPWQRKAIIIWWNGLKKYLKEKFPEVFQDSSGNFSEKTQAEILNELLSAMNENRPQENEKILACDVHSVLYSLNRIYENAKQRVS